jgi:hypothetical protein
MIKARRYIGPMTVLKTFRRPTGAGVVLLLSLWPHDGYAVGDKYRVTAAEKAACTEDAIRLCMDAYPSEEKLLVCMKENRASLSPTCRVAFDAGLKRRRL